MAFKALVADDEDIIRRGIIRFLKKYESIEVIAEAEDGEMALEIAEKVQLDILFVDINMPFLNGLQFIEQLRKIQPGAVVVIITGYDDFEYARQALRLGVSEYILKPIMEDTFNHSVEKVLKILGEKIEEKNYLNWAKTILKKNRSYLTMDFLNNWIEGHYSNEEVLEKMNYLDLDIPIPFVILLMSLDHIEKNDIGEKWNDDLLYYAAENITKEIFGELSPVHTCRDSRGNLILISKSAKKEVVQKLSAQASKTIESFIPAKVTSLCEFVEEYMDISNIYFALSDKLSAIKECPSTIKSIKEYIEQNYSREDFSLIDAAEYMNLSPQHLSRLFKKEMGITFVDYLTRVRIHKAIELFYRDEMKMYEIAELVGYSSQHYFSSVFKKEMGVAPIDYRKNCIEQQIHPSIL